MCRLTGWPSRAAHCSLRLRRRRQHVEGSVERPFGIVLVGHRRTEQGQHRIAQELGHEPIAAGDGLAQRVEEGALERAHLLGIEAFGQGREAAEVREQHRHRPAVGIVRLLLLPGHAGGGLRPPAARAEGKIRQNLETAASAGHRRAHQAVQDGRYLITRETRRA